MVLPALNSVSGINERESKRTLTNEKRSLLPAQGGILMRSLLTITPFVNETPITRASGIAKSGFAEKELGDFAINPALNCGVKCLYCSSDGMLCRLPAYREHVGNWWESASFVPYGNIVEIVDRDAVKLDGRDAEVVLSSVVDPYQARLASKSVPRAILERLAPTTLKVRILTKMVAVVCDLPYVADAFGDRATIGTSIPILNPDLSRIIEPFASPVLERQRRILGTAKELGLRRFVMGCPIIPGAYQSHHEFAEAWTKVVGLYEPEKVWFEPLNGRGRNLDVLGQGLREHGPGAVAERVARIRAKTGWSEYALELLGWVQEFARQCYDTSRVRFLLYPTMLTEDARRQVEADDACVLWL